MTANLERAEQSIEAAKGLIAGGFYDFAASRAYYAAFYAATAALLSEGLALSKHSGVIASVHQRLVKTGKVDKEQGKELNWLFGLRSVGDYGVTAHVSQEDAERAVYVAKGFLHVIKSLLGGTG
ncbi:MAG: hypothetical protein A2Y76_07785 [Planctomycetes bacterium RBG_13_60_9]|nr:MAG: hypothetical protein A2Y76_07785 [Planctomycetes bacterium RBG_13_60_9]